MAQRKPQALVDANVLYSALYKPEGVCGQIVTLALEGRCRLLSTESVREEVERNLVENLSMNREETSRLVSALPVDWISRDVYAEHMELALSLLSHQEDAPILAASLVTGARIVSGDKHFHSERVERKTRVLTPRKFLDLVSFERENSR